MKTKTLTVAGSAIIAILLITYGIALISNSRNKRNFNNEKLQNATLTSQKDQVSQDLDKAKSDLGAITSKDAAANKALAKAESAIAEKERRIAYISKENTSLMKDKNELVQLQKSKKDLNIAYSDLKMEHEAALSQIKNLENSALIADADKRELISKLESSKKNRIDNIEIYGSRGNKKDKLTYKARRIKDLNFNFDSPLGKTDEISYKIITPSGTIINPEDKLSSWLVVDHSPLKMTASLSSASGDPENLRQIVLKDKERDKLRSGEYTIQIFSNDKNVGSYRLKLR